MRLCIAIASTGIILILYDHIDLFVLLANGGVEETGNVLQVIPPLPTKMGPKQQQFYNKYYGVIITQITTKGYYKQTNQSALTIVSVITYDYVIIQFKITGCQNNVSNDTYRNQMLSINQKITGNPGIASFWELEVQNGEYFYLAKVSNI